MQYYDTQGAAARTRVAADYLRKLRTVGGGPQFIKIGRKVVYAERDLDEWMESHPKFGSTSAATAGGSQ